MYKSMFDLFSVSFVRKGSSKVLKACALFGNVLHLPSMCWCL